MTDTEKDWRELTDEEVAEEMKGSVDASLVTWRYWSEIIDALVRETDLSREEALLFEASRRLDLVRRHLLAMSEATQDHSSLVRPIIKKMKGWIEDHEQAEDWRDG